MSEQISILIIDDNIEFCAVLNQYLNQMEGLTVKGIAKDGLDGISKIKALRPDVIILDIIMPNLDGIGVLERMSRMQFLKKPIVIVLSGISKDAIIQKVMELGAEYYILKPFNVDMLVSRIRQLYNERENSTDNKNEVAVNYPAEQTGQNNETDNSDPEKIIASLIKKIGITPNIAGYIYLREITTFLVKNGYNSKYDIRNAYKEIANMHQVTQENVERSIKCAINSAFRKNQRKADNDISKQFDVGPKSSSSQIISLLVSKVNSVLKENKNK